MTTTGADSDTLAEAVETFLRSGLVQGWAEATIRNYRHLLGHLVAHCQRCGCVRWADVAAEDLQGLFLDLAQRGVAKKSRIQTAVLVKRFFSWLEDQGKILRHPARGLPLPDDGEVDLPPAPLSEADVATFLQALPRTTVYDLRHVALVELLYGCGLRISEAMALDLEDVDLDRLTVLVRESKHAQTRLVPLPRTTAAAIRDYLALRRTLLRGPDRGAFFLARGGRWRRGQVYLLFNRWNAARGPEAPHLYPHAFRHAIAVHLLRGGADIRHIQAFLGHAHLDTTKVYLRLVPGHLRDDYEGTMPEIATGLENRP